MLHLLVQGVTRHPKWVILATMFAMFMVGFEVHYDFTIFKLNQQLSRLHLQHQEVFPPGLQQQLDTVLKRPQAYAVTRYQFDADYFTHQKLRDIDEWVKNITTPECVVISPIDIWNLLDTNHSITAISNVVATYIKVSFFLNHIDIQDWSVNGVHRLHVFVVHPKKVPMPRASGPTSGPNNEGSTGAPGLFGPEGPVVVELSSAEGVKEFVYYFYLIHDYGYTYVLKKAIAVVLIAVLGYFLLHLFLSIANLHKVNSNVGILVGWMVEIGVSCTVAAKLVRLLAGFSHWEQAFQPSNFFTKYTVVMTMMVVSSRNLIRVINDLSKSNNGRDSPRYIKMRLNNFYTGTSTDNFESNYDKLYKLNRFLNVAALKIPNISKILLLNLVDLQGIYVASNVVMKIIFQDRSFGDILSTKIQRYFQVITVGLLVDHFFQLTFLVSIILIDNYRTDYTKILDDVVEVNILSYYFLRNKPPRDSWRFKIGTRFTFIRYPTSLKSWLIVLPVSQILTLLIVMINWALYLPVHIYKEAPQYLGFLEITKVSITKYFYLEFFLYAVFILSLSLIVMKSSNYKIEPESDTEEVEPESVFKSIDLDKGHYLDIIRLKSNNSQFLVTVGLDHRVLIWSPLAGDKAAAPISVNLGFWPINHVNILSNGEFIVFISTTHRLIRCYSRTKLSFLWTSEFKYDGILESCFRERTVPGFLRQQQLKKLQRRGSMVSLNGNYPSSNETKLEFNVVVASGEILTYGCGDGKESVVNLVEELYDEEESGPEEKSGGVPRILCALRLVTPRVNDRIVCLMDNNDLAVAIAINNKFKFLPLALNDNHYLQSNTVMNSPMTSTDNYSFNGIYQQQQQQEVTFTSLAPSNTSVEINKLVIVPIHFVGMIVRVNNIVAELIDVQTGVVLHKINVGHFKPNTFKVSHSEPTHCRFCGCTSIQSLSFVYEDALSDTVIIHNFKVRANRSKTNICLRVERDIREIRCTGFNDVVEEQIWYENVSNWEITDVNMIIGVRKEVPEEKEYEDKTTKLTTLKHRKKKIPKAATHWEGFIITLNDCKLVEYEIPQLQSSLVPGKVLVDKFGYKAVAVAFGNVVKILYLGNDKLIENNLYFNNGVNNELLFINKRRKK